MLCNGGPGRSRTLLWQRLSLRWPGLYWLVCTRTPTSLSRTRQTQGICLEGASVAASRSSLLLPAMCAKAFRVEGCFGQITRCGFGVGTRGDVRLETNLDLECCCGRCNGGSAAACWNNYSGHGDGACPLRGRAGIDEGCNFSDNIVISDMIWLAPNVRLLHAPVRPTYGRDLRCGFSSPGLTYA